MGPETVGTLVVAGIIVLALALYVFLIALGLRRLSFTLGTIIVGLRAIKAQTMPANPVLAGILNDVTGMESDLQGVLSAVGEASGAAPVEASPAPSMAEAGTKARGAAEPRLPEYQRASPNGEEEASQEDGLEAEEPVPVGAGRTRRSSVGEAVAAARARMKR